MCSCPDLLLVILSIIFPPAGALLRRGCGADFLINCGLTALGYLPGLIHAWYLICKYPRTDYEMLVDDDGDMSPHIHHVIVVSQPAAASSSSAAAQQQQPPPPYEQQPAKGAAATS
ncbi:plasma membrane proteolipid Pmp3 [Coemansia javaensis]|uniref:Plasma membrane proteolipid Pmp3 n=1 Tax=Coemansia javaensis TaxID=2761396 RepID=A0A9W8H9G7_9FUNG|nr:plasma membrane proteolipid Pmp3 [Coemansia javaensis]